MDCSCFHDQKRLYFSLWRKKKMSSDFICSCDLVIFILVLKRPKIKQWRGWDCPWHKPTSPGCLCAGVGGMAGQGLLSSTGFPFSSEDITCHWSHDLVQPSLPPCPVAFCKIRVNTRTLCKPNICLTQSHVCPLTLSPVLWSFLIKWAHLYKHLNRKI